MPRTTFIGNSKVDVDLDQAAKVIHGTIAKGEAEYKVSRSQTIESSGMSAASFYKAWNDPSLFRVGQLIRIYDFLKVPEPERRFA